MINALTVDLEEWFCGHILNKAVKKNEWNNQELRVVEDTRRMLRLFSRHDTEATFFVLGWLAERSPELIKEIADHGHEIATHGYWHTSLTEMTPASFEQDLKKALDVTRRCVKQEILGFRAPSFTITTKTLWALQILKDNGIRYDSSIFPLSLHPDYGIGNAPLAIHKLNDTLIEVPLSCVEILGKRIPCGGGYFRLYPYGLTKALLKRCNRQGRPAVFYLHPWELDPAQPRVKLGPINTLRHYYNLDKTAERVDRLLTDFRFTSIRKLLGL